MATITVTPKATNLDISGTTNKTGTISWTKPTVPTGATITSCVLTGFVDNGLTRGSATVTVNGKTVTLDANFTVNLGTANTTTSVNTTGKGRNSYSAGTIKFIYLVYTVTYEVPKATYTVTFKDWDGTVLKTQTVEEGSSATPPSNPNREGYIFVGWDKSYSNITANTTITALYNEIPKTENIKIGDIKVNTMYVGTTEVVKVYLGDVVVFG